MSESSTANSTVDEPKTMNRTAGILFIILALLIGGGAGYYMGSEMATQNANEELNQKMESMQSDLDKAKTAAGGEIEEGQQGVADLQAQNAALQQTVDEQTKQIAELQKQLDEAQSPSSTGTQSN